MNLTEMATTSIGNTSSASVAELVQQLKADLANGIPNSSGPAGLKASGLDAAKGANNLPQSAPMPVTPPVPAADVASVLFSEVATSDLGKLTSILNPAPDPVNNKVLDSLLHLAVQEVAKGNSERAVGYLADYATRDPRRAEHLPLQPELEPVRDKIDSMVSRMAMVAKISAEDGLSRAEQTASERLGKLSNWDTSADVLIKLAHRLFEAGGYANYSKTAELTKLLNEAGVQNKPASQAMAAAAAASVTNAGIPQMLPGINVPYWASPDLQTGRPDSTRRISAYPRSSPATFDRGVRQNLRALQEVSAAAFRQLWFRAPLLVLMLSWFALGIVGGTAFAMGSRIWPDSLFVTVGNIGFTVWALGFLALVGYGFYARVKYTPHR